MEPYGSSPCSEQPTNEFHLQPAEFNSHLTLHSSRDILILLAILKLSLWNSMCNFLSPPCTLHTLNISNYQPENPDIWLTAQIMNLQPMQLSPFLLI